MKKFALISVYDKKGLAKLTEALREKNVAIIATGGTAKYLTELDIEFTEIENITGNPESFDGRMKTISFSIEAGILYDRSNEKHCTEAENLKVPNIVYVVCNFYPFWEKPGTEMIDVGGPTMVRAAAKNYAHVTVLVDPKDYEKISEDSVETRKELAAKAFSYVADYDIRIANFFQQEVQKNENRFISMYRGVPLRYGENPHQKGVFYQDAINRNDPLQLGSFQVLQGKQASFNNLLDISAGLDVISHIGKKDPACVILKHTNPCGAAVNKDIIEAFRKAWFDGDSLAAFGGIILMNRKVNSDLAELMIADKKFFEVLVASEFDEAALAVFAQKPKLQLWENEELHKPHLVPYEDVKKIRGGYLVQDGDIYEPKASDIKVVTKKKPTDEQVEDLLFALKIAQFSKSNAVAAVKNKVLLASGVGQQDRKRCAELCVVKGGKKLKGAVAATDGFFPFRDGPDVLIKAGIEAIAQPGGSIRDQESIDACNEQGIAMVFTGVRNFKH